MAHPLSQEVVSDVRPTLWLLLGAVSLVLLIACVNVASLLLARAVSRERELAMRVALGAGRGRLVRQCLTESACWGFCGGVLGILLAAVSIRPFVAFWPGSLPRAEEVQLDWRCAVFCARRFAAERTSFRIWRRLCALHRANLERTLRGGARTVGGKLAPLARQFCGIRDRAGGGAAGIAPGCWGARCCGCRRSTRALISATCWWHGWRFRRRCSRTRRKRVQLGRTSWGAPAAYRECSPSLWQTCPDARRRRPVGYWTTPVATAGGPMPITLTSIVTPDYLKVMGMRLRRGRFLNEQDRMGNGIVVVIDDNLAQHAFAASDPVGKRLWIQGMDSNPVRMVGVVGHVRHWGLAGDDQSRVRDQIYFSFYQLPDPLVHLLSSVMSITVRTSITPLSVAEPLRRELRGPAADQTLYDVHTMDDLARASLDRQRFLLWLFGIFAALALLLACIGIYGVLTYLTNQRVPEIGLRMALGASARDVMRLVLGQSFGMIVVGIAVGILGALAAGRLLEHMVDGARPTDPSTFAIMIPVFLAAALIATFLPARRHLSRVDPMSALREE